MAIETFPDGPQANEEPAHAAECHRADPNAFLVDRRGRVRCGDGVIVHTPRVPDVLFNASRRPAPHFVVVSFSGCAGGYKVDGAPPSLGLRNVYGN